MGLASRWQRLFAEGSRHTFSTPVVTRRAVSDDFDTDTSDHPFRCAKCNRMQPRGTMLVWVSESADFFDTDGYARLAYTSRQSSHRSGWCVPCVERTKRIRDDF